MRQLRAKPTAPAAEGGSGERARRTLAADRAFVLYLGEDSRVGLSDADVV